MICRRLAERYGWTRDEILALTDEEALMFLERDEPAAAGGGHRVGAPARSVADLLTRGRPRNLQRQVGNS